MQIEQEPAERTEFAMCCVGTAGEVSFPYAFPKSGPYRIWVQTKSEGRILTGVFDTAVAAVK